MLSPSQKSDFRGKAHALKPVVLLGQHGYTPAVAAEINRALHDHELIKIKIASEEREDRKAITTLICKELNAELVQSIGKTVVLYRKKPKESTAG